MDPNRTDRPNPNANKEPAEGSRETVDANQAPPAGGGTQHGAGITNRPLEREQREQNEVPPRGQTKDKQAMANDETRDRSERESESGTTDVGRTTGGGSLGHDQPEKVKRDTPLRNNATGRESDPVMPADDSTLKTKI